MHTLELAEQFLKVIPASIQLIRRELSKAAPKDISLAQFRTLLAIERGVQGGTVLARETGVSAPSMSKLVDGMVKLGWVSRSNSTVDRRKVSLSLTAKGRAKVRSIKSRLAVRFSDKLSVLPHSTLRELDRSLSALGRLLPKEEHK